MSATHPAEWHERVRALLDAEIPDIDFVLWILVAVEPDAGLDEATLMRDGRTWLEGLEVEDVFDAHDEPTHIYEDQGLVIRFTAVPRVPAARGLRIPTVGNAAASDVHGIKVIRADTGAPTRAFPVLQGGPSSHP